MGPNHKNGRCRMTSVGHLGMAQCLSIASNNNSGGPAIGNINASSVGPRPAIVQNHGQPHSLPHGGMNTGFQAGPQKAANANHEG